MTYFVYVGVGLVLYWCVGVAVATFYPLFVDDENTGLLVLAWPMFILILLVCACVDGSEFVVKTVRRKLGVGK